MEAIASGYGQHYRIINVIPIAPSGLGLGYLHPQAKTPLLQPFGLLLGVLQGSSRQSRKNQLGVRLSNALLKLGGDKIIHFADLGEKVESLQAQTTPLKRCEIPRLQQRSARGRKDAGSTGPKKCTGLPITRAAGPTGSFRQTDGHIQGYLVGKSLQFRDMSQHLELYLIVTQDGREPTGAAAVDPDEIRNRW